MKKYIITILILLLSINTYAFSKKYDYNYEVTSFSITNDNILNMQGWAIINAGVNDGSSGDNASPSLNRNYSSCGHWEDYGCKNDNYSYKYSLIGEGLKCNTDGSNCEVLATETLVNKIFGSPLDLTAKFCRRDSKSKCMPKYSPAYVNSKFTFSNVSLDNLLQDSTKINSVRFYMQINSTWPTCVNDENQGRCKVRFPVAIPEEIIKDDVTKAKIKTTSLMRDVKILVNGLYLGNYEIFPTYANKKDTGKRWGTYKTIEINSIDLDMPSKYNLKVTNTSNKSITLGISSVYLAPPDDNAVIINAKPEKVEYNECTTSNNQQSKKTVTANKCSEELNVEEVVKNSCVTTDSSSYYSVDCSEKLIVKFGTFEPDTEPLKQGLGFNQTTTIKSEVTCTGTFDYTKWKEDHDKFVNLRKKQTEKSEYWYEYDNDVKKIENAYKKYISYDPGIYGSSPTANLELKFLDVGSEGIEKTVYKSLTVQQTKNGSKQRAEKVYDASVNPGNINETVEFEWKVRYPYTYYDSVEKEATYTKSTRTVDIGYKFLLPDNISPNYDNFEYCKKNNCKSIGAYKSNFLSAYKSYYPVKTTISGLGYGGNWTVVNDKCKISVGESKQIYRSIDSKNAFEFRGTDVVGENWFNDQFDFTEIIKPKTTNDYEFYITKNNIKDIKSDSNIDLRKYRGIDCERRNNKMVCPFLSNSKYFKKSLIKK